MTKNYQHKMILILFGLLAIGLGSAESTNSSGQPRLVIPEQIFDFGMIPAGKTVEHEFIIKNEGKAELEIYSVSPT